MSANSRTPSRGELGGVEVLDDEHAVAGVEELGHLERPLGILGRDRAVAPGVAAGERDTALAPASRASSMPGPGSPER